MLNQVQEGRHHGNFLWKGTGSETACCGTKQKERIPVAPNLAADQDVDPAIVDWVRRLLPQHRCQPKIFESMCAGALAVCLCGCGDSA